MSVFVWSMVGIALWHFTILVPDRFAGGIVGALVAAWAGAVVSGFLLDGLTLSSDNPPGWHHTVYAVPGALVALAAAYALGARSGRALEAEVRR